MAGRSNTQGGNVLPGFGELVQNLEEAQARSHRIDFSVPYSWALPGARPHSDGPTSPHHYTHSQQRQPLWCPPPEEPRDRVEEWRRSQGHSVPRRYPTPPRDAPPPTIGLPFDAPRRGSNEAGGYDNLRRDSSHPAPQFSQPGYRPGSGGSGYSQDGYSPRGFGHVGFSNGGHQSNGYHPGSYHTPASASGELRGRKRAGPSTVHEEADDAGRKRRNFPQHTINILKKWAVKRIDDLKFSQEEKDEIVRETSLDRNQVTGWYINYHRRGWAQDRWDHYKVRLGDAEAAYHTAVADARRVSDMDGDEARRAADAEVARLDALIEELRIKERLARKDLEEHKSKKRGV